MKSLPREFKRGDTFRLDCEARSPSNDTLIDLTGWSIRSQLRDATGALIYTFTPVSLSLGVTRLEAPSASTATWPLGACVLDVEYSDPSGFRQSTETMTAMVIEDVTQ